MMNIERQMKYGTIPIADIPDLTLSCNLFQIIDALKTALEGLPIATTDFVSCIWQGIMSNIDWNSRADQLESLVQREVDVRISPLLQLNNQNYLT